MLHDKYVKMGTRTLKEKKKEEEKKETGKEEGKKERRGGALRWRPSLAIPKTTGMKFGAPLIQLNRESSLEKLAIVRKASRIC